MAIRDIDERLFDYYLNSVYVLKFGDLCRAKSGALARYIDQGKALTNEFVIDDAVEVLPDECSHDITLPDDRSLERARAFIEDQL
jgi:hypothetical protein